MSGANSFGSKLVMTSFGESHGTALGVVLDGVPAGVKWSEKLLLKQMARRRPGQSKLVTSRNESDKPEILSGVYRGRTLGTPIAMIVRNQDARSKDYEKIKRSPRAGHADDVWIEKFGLSDPRGGGRSSGRETVSRVMAGAVARMMLAQVAPKLRIIGFSKRIGPYEIDAGETRELMKTKGDWPADRFAARFPSRTRTKDIEALLMSAKELGKSYGGVAEVRVENVPKGLGAPVFHKMKADLALACMSLGATAGFEIGDGFAATLAEGSVYHSKGASPDRYGGIRGGITTGEPLIVRVGFKPTSSVMDVAKKGRHDPCIVPRAVPVLEAMVAWVLADHLLLARGDRI